MVHTIYAATWVKYNQLPSVSAQDVVKIMPYKDGLLAWAKTNGGYPYSLHYFDKLGNLVLSKTMDSTYFPQVSLVNNGIECVIKPNNSIAVIAQTALFGKNLFITEIDENLSILKKDTITVTNKFRKVERTLPTSDNGMMMAVFEKNADSSRYVIYKFDRQNNIQWYKLIRIPEVTNRVPRIKVTGISNDNGKTYTSLIAYNVFYPNLINNEDGIISAYIVDSDGTISHRIRQNIQHIITNNAGDPVLLEVQKNGNAFTAYLSCVESNSQYTRIYKTIFDTANNILSSESYRDDLVFNNQQLTAAVNNSGDILSAGFRHVFLASDFGKNKVEIIPLDNISDKLIQFTKCVPDFEGGWFVNGYIATNGSTAFQDIFFHLDAPIGILKGTSFRDLNSNCIKNISEPSFSKLPIKLNGIVNLYTTTDSLGEFSLPAFVGNYDLDINLPNPYWMLCELTKNISISSPLNTFNIPIQPVVACPLLNVDISTPYLEKCKDNIYTIRYYNEGVIMAYNAYIELVLDNALDWVSGEQPSIDLGNNRYKIPLGNLAPFQYGETHFTVNVNCMKAEDRQTHCVYAHIFPDTICLETANCIDSSYLEFSAECIGDSIRLTIQNTGKGVTQEPRPLLILEEDIIRLYRDSIFLQPGESWTITLPADGNTYKFLTTPNSCYYYYNIPSSVIEGCGGLNNTGFVNILPQDDNSPYIAVSCIENVNSFPISRLFTQPVGYGENHYITDSTRIDYMVAFVNLGNSVAQNVLIIDTLEDNLDWSTFAYGSASHEVKYELFNNGILYILFENIALAPYTGDNNDILGYIKFSIYPKKDIPLGTRVHNNVSIYFDNNLPVNSNTIFHTIDNDFIVVETPTPTKIVDKLPNVKAYPNPSSESVCIEFPDNTHITYQVQLLDVSGNTVYSIDMDGSKLVLPLHNLPSGIYYYRILDRKNMIYSGRIIKQ
jgi:hypothetical protein